MKSIIKNIIFDIGGVLVDFNPLKILRSMGLSETEALTIHNCSTNSSTWQECDRGVIPRDEIFSKMISSMPAEFQKDGKNFLYNHITETVESFPYSADWLKSLKDQNFNIYLLTNYPEWLFEAHWKGTFTFSEYTDGKVVSAKVKLIKPDPAIYECLLKKYNLIPQESVFIDDRLDNIEAAQALGINGIHFTNFNEVSEKLNSLLKS